MAPSLRWEALNQGRETGTVYFEHTSEEGEKGRTQKINRYCSTCGWVRGVFGWVWNSSARYVVLWYCLILTLEAVFVFHLTQVGRAGERGGSNTLQDWQDLPGQYMHFLCYWAAFFKDRLLFFLLPFFLFGEAKSTSDTDRFGSTTQGNCCFWRLSDTGYMMNSFCEEQSCLLPATALWELKTEWLG